MNVIWIISPKPFLSAAKHPALTQCSLSELAGLRHAVLIHGAFNSETFLPFTAIRLVQIKHRHSKPLNCFALSSDLIVQSEIQANRLNHIGSCWSRQIDLEKRRALFVPRIIEDDVWLGSICDRYVHPHGISCGRHAHRR